MEKPSGADLYISVAIRNAEKSFSKGILVQSKWDRAFAHSKERRRLRTQARYMLDRTQESYIWIYEPTGIRVMRATAIFPPALLPIAVSGTTVGELIAAGLRCNAGDPRIGRDMGLPLVESLDSMLERLAAKTGLELALRAID